MAHRGRTAFWSTEKKEIWPPLATNPYLSLLALVQIIFQDY